MTTDWNSILESRKNHSVVKNFATGKLSGRDFYSFFSNTNFGGIVRGLLRSYGVDRARTLAYKALQRRELV